MMSLNTVMYTASSQFYLIHTKIRKVLAKYRLGEGVTFNSLALKFSRGHLSTRIDIVTSLFRLNQEGLVGIPGWPGAM